MPSSGWTPFPELNDVLSRLLHRMREALSDNLVGCYLQGSFAVGDFDEHSDVDFIAVTDRELADREVEDLQRVHAAVFDLDGEWAKHLEGSYFPRHVLARLDLAGTPLWYLDHGADHLILSSHCNTSVVRSALREHGVTLTGPEPAELLSAVPVAKLRSEILRTMEDWGAEILNAPEQYANRFYQGYIVLNYCRMLHDLQRGSVGSKRAGADWALGQLDPEWRPLIERAWSSRPDPAASVRQPADPADFRSTLHFVRHCIAQARALPTHP